MTRVILSPDAQLVHDLLKDAVIPHAILTQDLAKMIHDRCGKKISSNKVSMWARKLFPDKFTFVKINGQTAIKTKATV